MAKPLLHRRASRLLLGASTLALLGASAAFPMASALAGPNPPPPPKHPTGVVLYVSPHGTDTSNSCTTRNDPCQTIQHAVAVAPSKATIEVEPGTYTVDIASTSTNPYGGIDIFQPVSIEAQGHVVITGTGPIFTLYDSSSPSSGVTGVTIEGFAFDDITGSGYNGVITTPGYGSGDVTIARNTFSDITDEAVGYHGNQGLASPLGTGWRVVGNTVTEVTHSTRSGMFFGDLSDSVIEANTISDTGHAGILLTAVGASPASNSNNEVIGNQVSDVPYEGIQVAYGNGILIRDNSVSHAGLACMVSSPPSGCASGALSSASAIMLYNPGQTNITVIDNSATDSYNGLAVGQPPYSPSENLGAGIAVLRNDFTNDVHAGIADYAPTTSAALNAMLNWWGCAAGPNATGCTGTIGSVDYTPWATHPYPSPPPAPKGPPSPPKGPKGPPSPPKGPKGPPSPPGHK